MPETIGPAREIAQMIVKWWAERKNEQKTVLETTGPAQRAMTREIAQMNVMRSEERKNDPKATLETTGPGQLPATQKIVLMNEIWSA